jgi:L-fuculose-phosphate aldolase
MTNFLDEERISLLRQQLQEIGRAMFDHKLTLGNAGNLSLRIDADQYLITASGTHLEQLSQDDFVICNLNNGSYKGSGKPSKETPMHTAVYESRPEINAVLHASPFYTTLASCSDLEIPNDLFVENMYYLERITRVPYHHPGTQALGSAVRQKATQANLILMENHGVLAYDSSLKEALMAMLTLEMVCRMAVTAKQSGLQLNGLSQETVQSFLKDSGYRPRRVWGS